MLQAVLVHNEVLKIEQGINVTVGCRAAVKHSEVSQRQQNWLGGLLNTGWCVCDETSWTFVGAGWVSNDPRRLILFLEWESDNELLLEESSVCAGLRVMLVVRL